MLFVQEINLMSTQYLQAPHFIYNKEYNGITQGLAAVLSWLFNVIYILSQRELLQGLVPKNGNATQ